MQQQIENLETVVSPGSELESAFLVVERKIGDVDFAGTAQFDRRRPEHDAGVRHHGFTLHRSVVEVLHATREQVKSGLVKPGF